MATTPTIAPNQPVTYTLLVIFTVDPSTDEHSRGRYRIILVRVMAGVRRQVWSPDTRRTRCPSRQEGHHQESAAA